MPMLFAEFIAITLHVTKICYSMLISMLNILYTNSAITVDPVN